MGLREQLEEFSKNAVNETRGRFGEWAEDVRYERAMSNFNGYISKAAKRSQVSEGNLGGDHDPTERPNAFAHDPFDLVAAFGYRDKPTNLSYAALERTGRTVPVIADIIRTRREQVKMFCHLPEDRHSPGFKIKHRDWRNQKVTSAIEKESQALEQILLTTGFVSDARRNHQDRVLSLDEFAGLFTDDSLIYDQACLLPGTMIELANGRVVPVEAIEPGMQVVSHTGTQRTVVHPTSRLYTGEMVRVQVRGQVLDATAGHPFFVATRMSSKGDIVKLSSPDWVAADFLDADQHYAVYPRVQLPEDVQTTDVFAAPARRYPTGDLAAVTEAANVHPQTAYQILTGTYISNGPAVARVYAAAEAAGLTYEMRRRHEPETVIDAAWGKFLGLYAAEGSCGPVSAVLTFADHERHLVDFIVGFAERYGINTTIAEYADRAAVSVHVNCAALTAFLKREVGAGSQRKHVPACVLASPRDVKTAFLAGYFEGDAHVKGTGLEFSTTSRELFTGVRKLLSVFGVYAAEIATDYSAQGWSTQYGASISGLEYRELATAMGFPVDAAKPVRRSTIADEDYIYVKITAVKRYTVDNVRVYNMEVAEDHSYIANGIASHNCFEVMRDRKGRPSYMMPVDSGSIRRLDPYLKQDIDTDPKYVQVLHGQVVSDFLEKELAFCVRNPRTSVRSYGYGLSETETLAREITGLLWGMDYNRRFFCGVDQLVTTESGMEYLSDLVGKEFKVWNGFDWRPATAYATGQKPAVRTLLWNGLMLETSQKHRFRTITLGSSEPAWVRQEDLRPGDCVLVDAEPSAPLADTDALCLNEEYPSSGRGVAWKPTAALAQDDEFWEMMGFALGDGHFGQYLVSIFPHYEKDVDLFGRFLQVCQRHNIVADKVTINKKVQRADGEWGYPAIHIQHAAFIRWLGDLGFKRSAEGKRVPDALYRAPLRIRAALLRGLFSADGHSHAHKTGYKTPTVHVTDSAFRQTVLTALWSVGVASNDAGTGWNRKGDIRVQDIARFVKTVGYLQAYKNKGLQRSEHSCDRWDILAPGTAVAIADQVATSARWSELPAGDRGFAGKVRAGAVGLSRPRAIRWLTAIGAEIPEALHYVHVAVDVTDAEPRSMEPMFDIEVFDDQHTFLLNHIAVHNTNGSATKGILNFKGTLPEKHLAKFRRQWYSMISGVNNAWRTPITNAEELQWINMQLSNRDMEYSAWIDFLIKIACARFLIAPEEVNFQYGNTGQAQSMGSAPVEDKIKASKDLGLRPLVRFFFRCVNEHFLSHLNPDFIAVPVGMDAKGFEAEADLLDKQTKVNMTIDESRERSDMPPLGDEQGGNVIRDPVWLQWMQSKQQAEMGGMPGEEPGAVPGEEPDAAGDDLGGLSFESIDDVDADPDEAIKSLASHRAVVKYTRTL